jgi:apolipoprotein N-acyltransferase
MSERGRRSLSAVFDRTLPFFLGVLAALSLPPFNFWPALFVAVPLFIKRLSRSPSSRAAFLTSWAFGFGYFCFALHWIGYAFFVDTKTYLWMMPFAVTGLAAFLALYWGLAGLVAHSVQRNWQMPLFLTVPVLLWVGEALRGRLFTGFPWAAPGLAADGMGGTLQLASLIGMEGLTLLILVWAATPLVLLRDNSPRFTKTLCLLFLSLLPLGWAFGELRLAGHPTRYADTAVIRLVQPNVVQDEKWNAENADRIFTQLLDLTRSDTATTIIWPESAVPFLIDESDVAKLRLGDVLKPGQTLLTGAIRRETSSGSFFTSILMFDDTGSRRASYDKWRLVPGGEFLPLEWLLEPLGFKKLVTLPGGFAAGAGPQTLDVPGAGPAGLLICYEIIFPNQLVSASARPQWLVNVTNDGWFGLSTGPYQHLAQARMRAVEQGLPVMRSANTGISASIDAFGRVIKATTLGTEAAIEQRLPLPEANAVPANFHSWLQLLLVAFIGFFARMFSFKLN